MPVSDNTTGYIDDAISALEAIKGIKINIDAFGTIPNLMPQRVDLVIEDLMLWKSNYEDYLRKNSD